MADYESIRKGLVEESDRLSKRKAVFLPLILEASETMDSWKIASYLSKQGFPVRGSEIEQWVREYREEVRLSSRRRQVADKFYKLSPVFRYFLCCVFKVQFKKPDDSQNHHDSCKAKVDNDHPFSELFHFPVPLSVGLRRGGLNLRESGAGEQSGKACS